jgi:methylmalonyl-CoA mutase C-terminal domain/subunit
LRRLPELVLEIDHEIESLQVERTKRSKEKRYKVRVQKMMDDLRRRCEASPHEDGQDRAAESSSHPLRRLGSMEKARKLRVLVAKPGLDGNDFDARLVALAFCDAGFEVVYTGCRQTPEQIVSAAVQEDVDLIGLCSLTNVCRYSFPRVLELLRESNAEDIPVVGGGKIPPEDIPKFKEMGIKEIFEPGAKPKDIVNWVSNNVRPRTEIMPANWNGRRRPPAIGHELGWDEECIEKIRQPAAGNGHSLLNNVGAGRTLIEMAWYFEPAEMEQSASSLAEAAVRKIRKSTAYGQTITQEPGAPKQVG